LFCTFPVNVTPLLNDNVPPAAAVVVAPSFQTWLEAAPLVIEITVADTSRATLKLFNHTESFAAGA
jgi:hypothetical protein